MDDDQKKAELRERDRRREQWLSPERRGRLAADPRELVGDPMQSTVIGPLPPQLQRDDE